MKKIFISIILLLVVIAMSQFSYAANVAIDFSGETEITQDTKTISLILSLGEFSEIPGNPLMGYEAILEYDKTIFSSVKVEGLNDWRADYDDSTGRIIGEALSFGEANKQITQITLTVADNATPGNTTVKLKEGLLTVNDDEELDFTFEKAAQITIAENNEEDNPNENNVPNENATGNTDENTTGNQTGNQTGNKTNNNTSTLGNISVKGNEDKTTASKILPSTGIGKIALIVVLVVIIGIGCFIRYKSIKLK